MRPTGDRRGSGRPEDSGEMLLNGGEPVGILDRAVGGLVGNIGNAGQASIVAPSMSFHNVAMQVGQGSGYLGEETRPVGSGHFYGCMLTGIVRFQNVVGITSGLGRVVRTFGCSYGLHIHGKQLNQVDGPKGRRQIIH